jgi:hypothetical protein
MKKILAIAGALITGGIAVIASGVAQSAHAANAMN